MRAADQVDDGLITHQRLSPPVHADERKQTVLDLVPLTGAGRIVTNGDRPLNFVHKVLEVELPSPKAIPVAPSSVGTNQKPTSLGIALLPRHLPPAADALHGELRRVVGDPNVHHRSIPGNVVRPIRDRVSLRQTREVVSLDLLRLASGPPGAARIPKGSDELFLLGVHRDDGVAGAHELLNLRVDVAELLVSIRVLGAFALLGVGLKRVPHVPQAPTHRDRTHRMPQLGQLLRDGTRGLARPFQKAHGIAGRRLLANTLQLLQHARINLLHPLPATSWASNPSTLRLNHFLPPPQLRCPLQDRRARHTRKPRSLAHPPAANLQSLLTHVQSCLKLIEGAQYLQPASLREEPPSRMGGRLPHEHEVYTRPANCTYYSLAAP